MRSSIRQKLLSSLAIVFLWMALVVALNFGVTWSINRRWRDSAMRQAQAASLLSSLSREVSNVQRAPAAEATGRAILVGSLADQLQDTLQSEAELQQAIREMHPEEQPT